jgi:branched-subunit amino acid transport protein
MIGAAAALAVMTMLIKGAGALMSDIPPTVSARLAGLAPALLAALVVVELTNEDGIVQFDEKTAAVAFAVVLAWRRAPFAVCVIAAAVVAAVLRALL